jgi:hypothetical protein
VLCQLSTGNRQINFVSSTYLTGAQLTYALGWLYITENTDLGTINLPNLSGVGASLSISINPSLTVVRLPKLTYLATTFFFCENHISFVVPTGPPNAPSGGFKVTGQWKGQMNCIISNGATECVTLNICP